MQKQTNELAQLQRLRLIDEAIRSGKGRTAPKLAELTEVSTRTISRDVKALVEEFGAPLVAEKNGGYRYTDRSFFIPALIMAESDLFSLASLHRLAEQYGDDGVKDGIRSLFKKITSSLPPNMSVDFSSVTAVAKKTGTNASAPPPADGAPDSAVFEALCTALRIRHEISIHHAGSHHLVHPYHIHWYQGAWFLAGRDWDTGTLQVYAIADVTGAYVSSKEFTRPADFDFAAFFAKNSALFSPP
jgi:predicted DNA-binding transcriptional regulator YafY